MTEKINHFEQLAKINVNEHIEKKNNLSYLSWAWAVDQLMRNDPSANWEFHEPKAFGDTLMVSCTVTAFNKDMTMHLPVMDYKNRAISNPDAFAVNTAMMRCLAKAIAVHGLGLYIYAGEDLPAGNEPETKTVAPKINPVREAANPPPIERQEALRFFAQSISEEMESGNVQAAHDLFYGNEEDDEKIFLWSLLDSKIRSAIKKKHTEINVKEKQ